MLGRVGARMRVSAAAFRRALGNPALRRVQLAWAVSLIGSWAYGVALVVYTYDVGGAAAVGLLALLRQVPAALVSPFTAALADRFRRTEVMVTADTLRGILMVVAAVTTAVDGAPVIVFACAIGTMLVGTAYRPAQAALLPDLARDPEELASANVVSSTVESVGVFAGPALGGLLLAATGVPVVFAANAASYAVSVALVGSVLRRERADQRPPRPRKRLLAQATAGFRAAHRTPGVIPVLLSIASQAFVFGGLTVFVAVLALDVLDLGAAGVGLFNSAIGVGGIVGSAVAFLLVARARLSVALGVGVALWGLPLVVIGLVPEVWVAVALLAVVGLANTVVDVSGFTLIQRSVPGDVLASVFGALQASVILGIGAGAALAPVAIELVGEEGALVLYGALLPVLAVVGRPAVARIDAVSAVPRGLEELRQAPILAPLHPTTLEGLARALVEVRARAGEEVIRKGDSGDRFYVVEQGEVEIEGRAHGPGSSFGEIALLRDVPRTATVTARTDVVLLALEREDFVEAVTASEPSATAADAVIDLYLGRSAARAAHAPA